MAACAALAAASLLVLTALLHSIAGERRLISPVLATRAGALSRPLARFVLRFAWHLTSLLMLVLAVGLATWAARPAAAMTAVIATTGVAFTGVGIADGIATRGRHIGWRPLTLIGLAALAALALR